MLLVAAALLEKEIVEFKVQRMLITKREDQAADAGRSEDNDYATVSGSFNTIKVSEIPQTASKEMISLYFENKKRSGGGRHTVLEYQKEKGKAVIKFDNPEGMQFIYNEPSLHQS